MYNQSFTAKELYACTTQLERRNMGITKEKFISLIESKLVQLGGIESMVFNFRKIDDYYVVGYKSKSFDSIFQKIVLRKIHRNIKRIYGVTQSNRNSIIKILINLFKEDTDIWVVRTDISHFYESVAREDILDRFENDGRLTPLTVKLLRMIFATSPIKQACGLPRGLSISAVMSELYMRYFDYAMQRLNGVYYYARFVDDIIVLCSSSEVQCNAQKEIEALLNRLKLKINERKTVVWNDKEEYPLEYLGYSFKKGPQKRASLQISISKKKIDKIKTRLTRTFIRFRKEQNYDLLKKRIQCLTGNFQINCKNSLLPVKVGVYYNYKYATTDSEGGIIEALSELNRYYHAILHSKLSKTLTKNKIRGLEKYSFKFGYEKRVKHHFSPQEIGKIKSCWR